MSPKKFLGHPIACSCYAFAASAAYLLVAGPPRNALGLLGAVVLMGLAGLAVFFAASPPRYRPDGRGDAIGTLGSLVFSLGMSAIAFAVAAWAFDAYAALAWAGAAAVALMTGLATAAARNGTDE